MALILFDFDGVLADTLDDMLNFAQAVCAELNFDRRPTPADLDALETMSFVEYGKQLGVPDHLVGEFERRCLKKFIDKPSPPKIFAEMAQVIEELSEHHSIGIVTGNTTHAVENFLIENGIRQYISLLYAVNQPGSKAEKILKAKSQLAAAKDRVYYVGDAVSDIHAARRVEVKSIAVGWGHQSLGRLVNAHPDYVIHSPKELIDVFKKSAD